MNSPPIIFLFFSGSATTAHSVMQNNVANNKKCKFILIQIPEAQNEKKKENKVEDKTKEKINNTKE